MYRISGGAVFRISAVLYMPFLIQMARIVSRPCLSITDLCFDLLHMCNSPVFNCLLDNYVLILTMYQPVIMAYLWGCRKSFMISCKISCSSRSHNPKYSVQYPQNISSLSIAETGIVCQTYPPLPLRVKFIRGCW